MALENGALVMHVGPSPNNAGRLEHWHYDTFRARLGSGIDGWGKYGFGMAADGSIGFLTSNDVSFVRVMPPKPASQSM